LDLRSWSTEGEDSTGDLPTEEAEPKDQSLRKATSCNTPEAQGARETMVTRVEGMEDHGMMPTTLPNNY